MWKVLKKMRMVVGSVRDAEGREGERKGGNGWWKAVCFVLRGGEIELHEYSARCARLQGAFSYWRTMFVLCLNFDEEKRSDTYPRSEGSFLPSLHVDNRQRDITA